MASYLYDDVIEAHLEKAAGFWGMAARGLASAVPTAAKFGIGAATGLPVGKAGVAGSVAGALHGMTGSRPAGPSVMGMGPKMASRREKSADDHGWGSKLLHVSPYAAWAAGHLTQDSHPTLSKALTAGAYLGYAGSAAHDAVSDPSERVTSAVDAAALLGMLGSDIVRWNRK